MKLLAKKIKELRLSSGMRQHEMASKIGASQASVSKWENGKDLPDRENLVKLAGLAGVSVNEFMGLTEVPDLGGRRVSVIGSLAEGVWKEFVEWPEDDRYDVSVNLPSSLSSVPVDAYVVSGPSMNKMYPDGTVVYVSPVKSVSNDVVDGDIVMITRTNTDGLIEASLKEYSRDSNGKMWLWPRSLDPEHQAPLSLETRKRDSVVNMAIVGVVVAALVFTKRNNRA